MQHWSLPLSTVLPEGSIAHDQLTGHPFLEPFREHAPDVHGLGFAAAGRSYPMEHRRRLVEVIEAQYAGLPMGEATRRNVGSLADASTLTITTGHQLNLFLGPLYVPIKIMDVLALAARTSRTLQRTVVPVFWMATEDHDRAEVDHVWLRGHRFQWPGVPAGAVGRMKLTAIEPVLDAVCNALGVGRDGGAVIEALRESHRSDRTWAQATRAFLHHLFGHRGLVIIDGDDPSLKRLFIPAMRDEVLHGVVARTVADTNKALSVRHPIQAHARPINLFHLRDGHRARIEATADGHQVLQGGPRWHGESILDALERSPQDFSPNVLMRPLYQETVLPNIAYVGGAGELAYWMQLKGAFHALGIPMPVVLLRSGGAFLSGKSEGYRRKMGLQGEDLFMPRHHLMDRIAMAASGVTVDTREARSLLDDAFARLNELARTVDPTLERSVAASRKRVDHLVDGMEERIRRAMRRREHVALQRTERMLDELFPGGILQERRWSMLPWLVKEGDGLIDAWIDLLDPLAGRFTVMVDQ